MLAAWLKEVVDTMLTINLNISICGIALHILLLLAMQYYYSVREIN
jgi:hypothetical protein